MFVCMCVSIYIIKCMGLSLATQGENCGAYWWMSCPRVVISLIFNRKILRTRNIPQLYNPISTAFNYSHYSGAAQRKSTVAPHLRHHVFLLLNLRHFFGDLLRLPSGPGWAVRAVKCFNWRGLPESDCPSKILSFKE